MLLYALEGSKDAQRGSSITCQMSPNVWGNLPEDILERVLMMLPAATLFRLRTLSKAWRGRLSCDQFFKRQIFDLPQGSHSDTPAICAFTVLDDHSLWNELRRAWLSLTSSLYATLDLTVLPAKYRRLYAPPWCSYSDKIVSNHGLLCVCFGGRGRLELCVVNPLTGRWRELPELNVPDQILWKMQVDAPYDGTNPGAFQVFVILCGQWRGVWTVGIFSSKTASWRITAGENAPGVAFSKWSNSSLVVAGGMLYGWDSSGLHMTMHRLSDGKLLKHCSRSLPVAGERHGCCDRHLVEHCGAVYFVTSGENFLYQIFKLEKRSWTWKPISKLPEELHSALLQDSSVSLLRPRNCTVIGDSICFVLGVREVVAGVSRSRTRLFAYNIVEQSWHLLFRKQLENDHPIHNFTALRFFRPRFDIVP